MNTSVHQALLESLVDFYGGGTPSKKNPEFYNGKIPWVTPKDMKTWEIFQSRDYITSEAIEEGAAKLIQPDCVLLVVRSGVLKHSLPVAINRVQIAINQDMKALKCCPELLPDFLAYYLKAKSHEILNWVRATTADNIPVELLKKYPIPLPPLPEQRRIAAILDKANSVRRKRQEAIKLTEEFLRSVFLGMFGDPVTNPKGWDKMSFGEISPEKGQIVDGPFGSSLKPECYVSKGIRVVRNFNIKDDFFDGSQFKYVTKERLTELRRSEVIANDILISTKATVGNVCMMPDLPGESLLSATGTVRIRLPKGSPVEGSFLVSQMITNSFREYVHRFESGTNQKYLNLSGIRKMEVIIPPKQLQEKFLRIKAVGLALLSRNRIQFSTSDDLFNSLVNSLFVNE